MTPKLLNLTGVAFCEDAPPELEELKTSDKYCRFIGRARKGASFCVKGTNISCPLARFHLGIDDPDLADLARTLVGWSDAVDVETGITFLENATRLDRSFSHICFLAGNEAGVEPDLLIKVCSADEAQGIVQRYSAKTGKRMLSPISGIGAACGECTGYVLAQTKPVVSLGCNGSRPGVGLQQGELLLAATPDSVAGRLMAARR
ncbi:MAG: DUF169 domain-containing protein [Planctomycetes bacterium]|nr:DUF169 domain-containing protein [Planctomycetota bacterium]